MMFSKFAAYYGHVWRSQFKTDDFFAFAKKEWREGLSKYSDDTLQKVTTHCRDWSELPPTLPQIIGLCREITRRNDFFLADKNSIKATPAVVNFNLQQCKNILTQGEIPCSF